MKSKAKAISPEDVVRRVRREHVALRTYLDAIELSAAEVLVSGMSERFRSALFGFEYVFVDHLAMEERLLLPLIVERGGDAEAVLDEHVEQRGSIHALLDALSSGTRSAEALALDALAFVASLRADMDLEERELPRVAEETVFVFDTAV